MFDPHLARVVSVASDIGAIEPPSNSAPQTAVANRQIMSFAGHGAGRKVNPSRVLKARLA
jgi:hypothetical protein